MPRDNLLKKLSKCNKKDKIDKLNDMITRVEFCQNYKFIISTPFIPDVKFRKFFKQNGGLIPHINNVYYINTIIKYYDNTDDDIHIYDCVSVFDFDIFGNTYYGYLLIEENNGCCRSCGLGYASESKMYIATTLEHLINYELAISDFDKFV